MQEHEDGRVSGSINRARVAELYNATDDEDLKAHYREVLGESEEGKAIAEQEGDTKAEAGVAEGNGEVPDDQPKASMALSKDELVALANDAGVEDAESKTKAELVEALGGNA